MNNEKLNRAIKLVIFILFLILTFIALNTIENGWISFTPLVLFPIILFLLVMLHLTTKSIKLGLFGIIVAIIFTIVFRNVQHYIFNKNTNKIIVQIELYKQDKGYYPEHIEDLIPEYFNRLPKLHRGLLNIDYEYTNDYNQSIYLELYTSWAEVKEYDFITRTWSTHTEWACG